MIAAIVAGAYAPNNVSPANAQGAVAHELGREPPPPDLRMLDVRIGTGDDDLREDSKVFVGLVLASGKEIELPFVSNRRLPDRTSFSREIALPNPVNPWSITAIKVRFQQGPGGGLQGADQWVMDDVEIVGFTEEGRSRTVLASTARKKFQSSGVWRSTDVDRKEWKRPTCGRPTNPELCFEVGHGGDDLRHDSGATIQVEYVDGRLFETRVFGGGGSACVPLPVSHADLGLRRVRVQMSRGGRGGLRGTSFTDATDQFVLGKVTVWQKGTLLSTCTNRRTLFVASPLVRMRGHGTWESTELGRAPLPAELPPEMGLAGSLRARVLTGDDDLKSQVQIGLELVDGRVLTAGVPRIDAHSRAEVSLPSPPYNAINRIRRVTVSYTPSVTAPPLVGGTPFLDRWDLASLEIVNVRPDGAVTRLWGDATLDKKFTARETWRSPQLPTFGRPYDPGPGVAREVRP